MARRPTQQLLSACLLSLALAAAPGCAPNAATANGHSTALDSVDLYAMTDRMAQSIMASPAVQAAIRAEGSLRVVIEPVENEMVGEVLPRGQAEMFTGRVRSLLAKQDGGRLRSFTWVMNRDAWHDLQRRELDFDLGPSPDTIQPRYALTARFSSLTQEDASHRSAYILCAYQLTDVEHRNVLWGDRYEVRKSAAKGMLD